MCPNCRNTLSVVPSDPPDPGDGRIVIPISTVGEPPFLLYCNYCRWDSSEVGITFEKPTGLAAQLQKFEDSAPDSLEFDRLKEHFEPIIRASSLSSSTLPTHTPHSHHHTNPITAAATAALARDIPGVGKYAPLTRSQRGHKDKSANKDEMPLYKGRLDIATASKHGSGGGELDVEMMRSLEDVSEIASLEQRWNSSWSQSIETRDLKPLRIPLHSKRSKRCPACTHILIKPEQKAQSVRFKIKLTAASYLPAIIVALPHRQQALAADSAKRSMAKSTSVPPDEDRDGRAELQAGKTYPFHLALSNPMYDPIQVRLSVQRMHVPQTTSSSTGDGVPERARRPPFAISLPTTPFTVAAYAEAWEYEDDEDMFGLDDDEILEARLRGEKPEHKAKPKSVGVVEKKGNTTIIGGEVVIGKEARGNVKFNMLVSFTYRSDDPVATEGNLTGSPTKSKGMETKTFAFYTVVDLGAIIPKEEAKHIDDI
ncbi:hypothetical protein PM082_017066 [Marasmius tenuissimus]|nr:hypothetical protein PM082_017066 [Marasmius tenuissimus]